MACIKSGVAEKYARLVQVLCESTMTGVRCAIGVTDGFKVEVGLHQGSSLNPFLAAMVMDRLTSEVRQESLWMMMVADNTAIYNDR